MAGLSGTDFPENMTIAIMIGGAVAPTAVAVRMIHGNVTRQTPKAIQITDDKGRQLWLPKFCLEQFGGGGVVFKLTRRFDRIADGRQWDLIDSMSEISGQSAN